MRFGGADLRGDLLGAVHLLLLREAGDGRPGGAGGAGGGGGGGGWRGCRQNMLETTLIAERTFLGVS